MLWISEALPQDRWRESVTRDESYPDGCIRGEKNHLGASRTVFAQFPLFGLIL
jgi:hypothetical protein